MNREAMLEEAEGLTQRQVADRGTRPWDRDGRKVTILGSYEATPEREGRAARIIELRRGAAKLEGSSDG